MYKRLTGIYIEHHYQSNHGASDKKKRIFNNLIRNIFWCTKMTNRKHSWRVIILIISFLFRLISARTYELCQEKGVLQDQDHQQWRVMECTKYISKTRNFLVVTDPGIITTTNYILRPNEGSF